MRHEYGVSFCLTFGLLGQFEGVSSFVPSPRRLSARAVAHEFCSVSAVSDSPGEEDNSSAGPPPCFGDNAELNIPDFANVVDDSDFNLDAYSDPNDTRYSAADWLHNVKSIRRSSILNEIKQPVLSITAWSVFVSVVHKILLVSGLGQAASKISISGKPHSLLVSSIGLLLVFRTNSAYQRFAEGRRIWEKILSITRSVSRMAFLYEGDLGSRRRLRVQRLLAAFPYLLRHHIQPCCLNDQRKDKGVDGTDNALWLQEPSEMEIKTGQRSGRISLFPNGRRRSHLGEDNRTRKCLVDRRDKPWSLLPKSALLKCVTSPNRPLWICDRLSKEFTNVQYSDNFTSRERLSLLSGVDRLSQCIGECERIHQTAVPLNYARHSLRSLTVWLFSLPFCLIEESGLLTGPIMAVIAWLLLGVYEIGYSIEDPFQGSLRLNILCDAIYRDVMYSSGEGMGGRRETAFEISKEELNDWDLHCSSAGMPRPNGLFFEESLANYRP